MSRAGSIKREGDTWFFVVDVGNGAGRRRQVRKRGFATKREARAALTEALGELQRGTYVRPQRITVAAYLDDWLASRTTVGLRPSTTADHVPVAGETKTTRSRRAVDLDAVTASALRAHRRHQREERMLLGPGWRASGLVFPMPDGSGWHPDVITRAFARLVERSGLPRIRLHELRHTHAPHLLAAGVNVRVVSERLGHASTAFTLDVYGHVLPGQQADAAAAVAALVDR